MKCADYCVTCVCKNDIDACEKIDCCVKASWYVRNRTAELIRIITRLKQKESEEDMLKNLKF